MNSFFATIQRKIEKGVALLLSIVHMGLAFKFIKARWPETVPSGYALVALFCVAAVMVEMHFVETLLRIPNALFDLRGFGWRSGLIVVFVFLFAGGWFAYEAHDQAVSDEVQRQSQLDRKAYYDQVHQIRSQFPNGVP